MTKVEAVREVALLASGTIASITGLRRYEDIDLWLEDMVERIEDVDVSRCRNWMDILEVVQA